MPSAHPHRALSARGRGIPAALRPATTALALRANVTAGGGGRGGWGDAGRPVRQTARAAHPVRVGRAECWAPRAGSPQNVWLCEIEGISQLQDGICGVGATAWMGQNQARKAGAAQQGETARHAAKLAAGGVRRANPLRRALRGLVSHFPGKQSRQHDPSTGNPNPA